MSKFVWFKVVYIRLSTEINFNLEEDKCWAHVSMKIDDEDAEMTAEQGVGPVDACFEAMKKLIEKKYPLVSTIRLVKFSVPEKDVSVLGSEASVNVRIGLRYNGEILEFESESTNIERACAYAFVEGFNCCLSRIYCIEKCVVE